MLTESKVDTGQPQVTDHKNSKSFAPLNVKLSGFSPVLPFYVQIRPFDRKQRLNHLNESDTRLFEKASGEKKVLKKRKKKEEKPL